MTHTPSALASHHRLEPDLPPLVAVLIGALLGGLGGFLFLSTRGGRVRHDITVASARLFDGLDSALGSWARLQRHATAASPVDPIVAAASRDTSRSGIPIQ